MGLQNGHREIVSIIVPVYNAALYLGQCVDSLLSQTYSDVEVLLIDDGSTDGSRELCDSLASSDRRVRVAHQANEGVSSARNKGMGLASGDYIMFVDADDWLVQDAIETLLDATRGITSLTLFDYSTTTADGTGLLRANNFGSLSGLFDASAIQKRCLDVGDSQMLSSSWTLFVEKRTLLDSGVRFNRQIKMMEDLLFLYELLQNVDRVLVIDKDLYRWRQSPTSSSHGYIPAMEGNVEELRRLLMELGAPLAELDVWTASMCSRIALSECRSSKSVQSVAQTLSRLKNEHSSELARLGSFRDCMRGREYLIARTLSVSPLLAAVLLRMLIRIKE